MGRVREEKRRAEERRSKKRKSQKEEDPGARKGRKVAKHCVFPAICGPGGSKSRLAKAAGAEPAGQMRDEKLHAGLARSTFASEKAKSTSRSEHFWKLRCWKSARCCGAKHISKSKCTKHTSFGELLQVEIPRKCTLLWREAHVEVKSGKNWVVRSTFWSWDVGKSARRCGAKHISNQKKTKREGFVAVSTTTAATLHSTTLQLQLQLHYTTLITLHYTTTHYTNYNYNYTNYTTLYCTPLHYTTLHVNYTTRTTTTLRCSRLVSLH